MTLDRLRLAPCALFFLTLASGTSMASLIGDPVGGTLRTEFAGSFVDPTATVGAGAEFTSSYNAGMEGTSLDIGSSSFVFTFFNTFTGSDVNPSGLFNLGLLGFDWSDSNSVITGVTLLTSNFPAGSITSTTFDAHNIHVDIDNPIIPGFGTVWSATWNVTTADTGVPEPGALSLMGLGSLAMLVVRRRRRN
jgi:PEP-CTERM motif